VPRLSAAGDLMACGEPGKSSAATWQAFRVRVSMRPWPVSRAESPAGYCRQGQGLDLACSSGWLRLRRRCNGLFCP